ncbi:DUF418 domain-containing protein [Nocardiopsis synnemataformans]|uniref:DUF418 domain-containing protein n=1 Tax=Nocardiopsis synnemataformans TaxID=61305 RepID=UPI003EBF3B36
MLLLIAVANAHYWFAPDLKASEPFEELVSDLLYLLVDGRAYPLFALLLGFGLATIAHRSIQVSLAEGLNRKQAEQRATSQLRRRGLWLLAFGTAHALIFAHDILGVYGLVTVLIARIVVSRRSRTALVLAVLTGSLSMTFIAVVGPAAALTRSHGLAAHTLFDAHIVGVMFNLAVWTVSTPVTVLSSMVLPSVLLGAWLAGQGMLEKPYLHRQELAGTVLAGFVVPTVTFPMLWVSIDGADVPSRFLIAWHQSLAGMLAGAGYLALVALVVSCIAGTGIFSRILAATGKRSLSTYLSQTLLLALGAGALRICGVETLALAWQVFVATTVWLVSILVCSLMEYHGIKGPAERGLRRLVATGVPR